MSLAIHRISKIPKDGSPYAGCKLRVETSVGVSTCYVLTHARSWDFQSTPKWEDLDEALDEFLEAYGWQSPVSLLDHLREHNTDTIERAPPPSLWDHLLQQENHD